MNYSRTILAMAVLGFTAAAYAGTATYSGNHTGSDIQITGANSVIGVPAISVNYTGSVIEFSRASGLGLAQIAAATGSGNLSVAGDFVFEAVVTAASVPDDNDGVGIMLDAGSNNANTIFLAISNDNGTVGLYRANGAIDSNVERGAEGTLAFPVTLRLTRSDTTVTIEAEDASKALVSFTSATLNNASVSHIIEFLDFGAGGGTNSLSVSSATVTGPTVPDINGGSPPPPPPPPGPIPTVPTGSPVDGGAALVLLTAALGGLLVRRARQVK